MNRGWKGVAAFFGVWIVMTAVLFPAVRMAVEAVVPGMFTSARIFGRVQLGVALALVPVLFWFWKDGPMRLRRLSIRGSMRRVIVVYRDWETDGVS